MATTKKITSDMITGWQWRIGVINRNSSNNKFPWLIFTLSIPYESQYTYDPSNSLYDAETFGEIPAPTRVACVTSKYDKSGSDYEYSTFNYQSDITPYSLYELANSYVCKVKYKDVDISGAFGVFSLDGAKRYQYACYCCFGVAFLFTNGEFIFNRIFYYSYTTLDRPVKPFSYASNDEKGVCGVEYTPLTRVGFYGTRSSPDVDKAITELLQGLPVYNANDPYQNSSGVGDDPDDPGQGDFDYSSDDVPIPDLPETDVTDSGLVSLFAPNDDQLQRLAKFLWSDTFSLDSFKKILNNPMDCILGLSKLPVHLPHGTSKEITVGNVVSTVSCDTCKQYLKLNCGTFTFSRSRFTGGYLDNAPYTRCYLYLPFIGTQEINIDEFMGATMGIEYHIDVLTGAMFCFVTRNGKLLLTFAGNCAENVPLSANDFTSTISSMLSMATVGAGAVATIATAGAAAPTTAGMASEALGARTASSLIGAGAQGASAVMNSKPNVQHSGSLGGGAGAMGQLYPYLIFIAPRPDIPTDQNMYTGFPSNDIVQIGNLKDFNVIEAVNLKVEGANDTEMSEIEAILKGGVII